MGNLNNKVWLEMQPMANYEALDKKNNNKNIWINNEWIFPKANKKYKPTDPRSSMNPKHKKHGENYSKAHYYQIGQN